MADKWRVIAQTQTMEYAHGQFTPVWEVRWKLNVEPFTEGVVRIPVELYGPAAVQTAVESAASTALDVHQL